MKLRRAELIDAETNVSMIRAKSIGLLGFVEEETVPVVYLYELHIANAARRLGLGAALVAAVQELGEQAVSCGMMPTVDRSNQQALHFYQVAGLEVMQSNFSLAQCTS